MPCPAAGAGHDEGTGCADPCDPAGGALDTGDNRLQATSASRRDPVDRPVPEIGDEFAAGRALVDLGYRLLRAGNSDSSDNTVDVPK
ncbi:dsRBD fold-containing protein [Streptacidiphilus anmyonensis]|uniref:dsRBD fold-containing protein n=1 Tax=Streptacidiphilus anmyonensis TaxID=405782 RepID=UPI000693E4C7|nr:dsRBD fold-containing protein [Streptacidiphilus anmyonensis]